jgi:hypothetical protein
MPLLDAYMSDGRPEGIVSHSWSFQTPEALSQHSATVHGPTVNNQYSCLFPSCAQSFQDNAALIQHGVSAHRSVSMLQLTRKHLEKITHMAQFSLLGVK